MADRDLTPTRGLWLLCPLSTAHYIQQINKIQFPKHFLKDEEAAYVHSFPQESSADRSGGNRFYSSSVLGKQIPRKKVRAQEGREWSNTSISSTAESEGPETQTPGWTPLPRQHLQTELSSKCRLPMETQTKKMEASEASLDPFLLLALWLPCENRRRTQDSSHSSADEKCGIVRVHISESCLFCDALWPRQMGTHEVSTLDSRLPTLGHDRETTNSSLNLILTSSHYIDCTSFQTPLLSSLAPPTPISSPSSPDSLRSFKSWFYFIYKRSRNHKWKKKYPMCLSETGLINLMIIGYIHLLVNGITLYFMD